MVSKIFNTVKEKTKLFATMLSSLGILGTLNLVSVNVLCGNNANGSTGGSTLLWDTSANEGILDVAIQTYQHWWWVAVVVEVILWVVFTVFHKEKPAEISKNAVWVTVGVFIFTYAIDPIKASITYIAGLFNN